MDDKKVLMTPPGNDYEDGRSRVFFLEYDKILAWLTMDCVSFLASSWTDGYKVAKKNGTIACIVQVNSLQQRFHVISGVVSCILVGVVGRDHPIAIGFFDSMYMVNKDAWCYGVGYLIQILLDNEEYELIALLKEHDKIIFDLK